jgi:hypothetical protein
MRFRYILVCALLVGVGLSVSLEGKGETRLRDIYKSGKIEFKVKMKLGIDSFPVDVRTKTLSSIAVAPSGDIFIGDVFNKNIRKLSPAGKFLKVFGRPGKGPGDLDSAGEITVSERFLIVSELKNRRFSIFDLDGRFIRHVKLDFKAFLKEFRRLDNGQFLVEFWTMKAEKKELFQEFILALYSTDLKYIKTICRQRVYRNKMILKPFRTNIPHPFNNDVYWDILPQNRLVIGYSRNYELEIHDLANRKVKRFSHDYKPQKVTELDKKKYFGSLMFFHSSGKVEKGAHPVIKEHTEFPQYKPAFEYIMTDCQGNILVFPYKKDSEDSHKYFDAFDQDGRFINRVTIVSSEAILPQGLTSVPPDVFWCLIKDEEDEPFAIQFEVK